MRKVGGENGKAQSLCYTRQRRFVLISPSLKCTRTSGKLRGWGEWPIVIKRLRPE